MGINWEKLAHAKDNALASLTQGLEMTMGAIVGGITGYGISTNLSPWILFSVAFIISIQFVLVREIIESGKSDYFEPDNQERLKNIEEQLDTVIDEIE